DGGVTSAKILDGTIAMADLAAATVSALQPESRDEGVAVAADTTAFDFVGAGVTASAVGGVVTVSVPGGVAVPLPQMQVFVAGGTWTKPSGCRSVRVRV